MRPAARELQPKEGPSCQQHRPIQQSTLQQRARPADGRKPAPPQRPPTQTNSRLRPHKVISRPSGFPTAAGRHDREANKRRWVLDVSRWDYVQPHRQAWDRTVSKHTYTHRRTAVLICLCVVCLN